MAKIKIILDKNETEDDANLLLEKALKFHRNGDAHDKGTFDDVAMVDLSNQLDKEYKAMLDELLQEVIDSLESEYSQW